MALPRKYIRDWRGRFAHVPSSRVKQPRGALAVQAKQKRHDIATALYRKRSEEMVARHATEVDWNEAKKRLTPNREPEPDRENLSDFIKPWDIKPLKHSTHDEVMNMLDRLTSEQRIKLRHSDIRKSSDRFEAQLIFRARHGTKVKTAGWDSVYIDNDAATECFAALDDMLTKYPDVELDEFYARPPEDFDGPRIIAHCARYINRVGIEFNRYWLENTLQYATSQLTGQQRGWNPPRSEEAQERYGHYGASLVHEFGHAVDYTAYFGQWAQEISGFNPSVVDTDKMRRLDEIQAELNELVLKDVDYDDTRLTELREEAMKLFTETKKFPKEKFPTIAQGRNSAMRQALIRAYNRHRGHPEKRPMSPKQDDWYSFKHYLHTHTSSYSIDEDAPRDYDGIEGHDIARPLPIHPANNKYQFHWSELVAESFADVELNGSEAWETSKQVHDTLTWQFNQKNRGLKARFQK